MCTPVSMSTQVQVPAEAGDIRYPGAEMPNVDAGNQTWSLWKSSEYY